MPTYEYECRRCGRRFEKFQKMSDRPKAACPDCGGAARRLIGAGGAVIVKGSPRSAASGRSGTTRCDRDAPCCGRQTPCDLPPCAE
jgi:putative FmdB family regulatory protein